MLSSALYGPDTLLSTLYFYLECPAQNIKKRLVLKPAITKAGKIDIGQIIQIVKHRDDHSQA